MNAYQANTASINDTMGLVDNLANDTSWYMTDNPGAYISFDAGDHWQSLQINLPDTPIRDLVVTDHDVVLGTHGRAFWVLDDIEPLRQMTPAVYNTALTVFEPSQAVRGVGNGVIQYFLKDAVDEVTMEILDESGKVVRTISGTAEDEKNPPPVTRRNRRWA